MQYLLIITDHIDYEIMSSHPLGLFNSLEEAKEKIVEYKKLYEDDEDDYISFLYTIYKFENDKFEIIKYKE